MSRTGVLMVMAATMLATGGCIQHQARIAPATQPGAQVLVGDQVQPTGQGFQRTSPLPHDLPVVAWVRDGEGLWRADADVQSPLPWWQRFPADVAAELWPYRLVIPVQGELRFARVPRHSLEALDQRAAARGWAPATVENTPPSE